MQLTVLVTCISLQEYSLLTRADTIQGSQHARHWATYTTGFTHFVLMTLSHSTDRKIEVQRNKVNSSRVTKLPSGEAGIRTLAHLVPDDLPLWFRWLFQPNTFFHQYVQKLTET